MYKKVFISIILGFFIFFVGGITINSPVSAAEDTPRQTCLKNGGEWRSVDGGDYQFCDNSGVDSTVSNDKDSQKILDYLQAGINLASALAGLAITAAFIIGGIQYSTSGGNPQASAAAKKRIGNAVLALLALIFLYTFLQWLVPGGIFG